MRKLLTILALGLGVALQGCYQPVFAQAANYGGAVNVSSFSANCIPLAVTAVTLQCGALTDNGTTLISAEGIVSVAGTTTVPAYSFTGGTTYGFTFVSSGIGVPIGGNYRYHFLNNELRIGASTAVSFSANNDPTGTASDTSLTRDAAVGTLALKQTASTDAKFRIYGANGAFVEYGSASELLTLSTSGTTTDTTGNLLPANSIIDSVDARVTTTITTATSWQLGDASTAGRFSAVNAVMTSGSTQVGDVQADQTGASGPRQVSAAKVRVTTVGTPGAGVIRITVHYHSFTPPTS